MKRLVALKMILSGQMATADERERFRREAEWAGNLDHPNIVRIFEVEEFEGCPYFIMQLVEGDSLAKLIKKKSATKSPYEPKAAAHLMVTIARAVHYAPQAGLPSLRPQTLEHPGRSRGTAARHRFRTGQTDQRG